MGQPRHIRPVLATDELLSTLTKFTTTDEQEREREREGENEKEKEKGSQKQWASMRTALDLSP